MYTCVRIRTVLPKKCWIAIAATTLAFLCCNSVVLAYVTGGFDSVKSVAMTGVNDSALVIGLVGVANSGLVVGLAPGWVPPIEEPTPPEYVSETPAEDMFAESAGVNIPIFYPMFKMASDTTGWPIQIFWISGALVMAMIAGALTVMYLRSMLLAGLVSGAVVAAGCSMGILPWWILYTYIFAAVTFIVYQRVVSA